MPGVSTPGFFYVHHKCQVCSIDKLTTCINLLFRKKIAFLLKKDCKIFVCLVSQTLLCCNKIENAMTTMTIDELKRMIADYTEVIDRIVNECETHKSICKSDIKAMYKDNNIIEVGSLYTIGIDDQGRTMLQIVTSPCLFSDKAKDEILSMTFRDGFGQVVTPVVYNERDWHLNRLEENLKTLKMLNAMVASLRDDLNFLSKIANAS
jgi:hypothetical protein